MGNLVRLFSALSDTNRLRILAALKQYSDMCACQIVELLQVSGATTSRHLSLLMQVGLLDSFKEGRWVHYRLNTGSHNYGQVIDWLEKELEHTDVVKEDQQTLKKIMTADRKALCRGQR